MPRNILHQGYKFGTYEIVAPVGKTPLRHIQWLCLCSCGAERVLTSARIFAESGIVCGGCGLGRISTKPYDLTRSVWRGVLDRTVRKSSDTWAEYGGKGVMVCEAWLSYENFLRDMGERPSVAYSINRIDNSRGYEPENCEWATADRQARNKFNTVYIEVDGKRQVAADYAESKGIKKDTLIKRIRRAEGQAKGMCSSCFIKPKGDGKLCSKCCELARQRRTKRHRPSLTS